MLGMIDCCKTIFCFFVFLHAFQILYEVHSLLQDQYEEVDIVIKGGNYGWRVYEGPMLFHPTKSPGGTTSASSINPIFPAMGYNHSNIDKNIEPAESASITGGYFYRSMTDPCMYKR